MEHHHDCIARRIPGAECECHGGSLELDGFELSLYRSTKDGSLVVDMHCENLKEKHMTNGLAVVRVWLNECLLYECDKSGEERYNE